MQPPHQDTIVIGGGLAGLVIARELSAAGHTVALLEARSRLGGRVYFESFADTNEFVEYGGNWFALHYQPLTAAEFDRYGLELTAGEPGTQSRTFIGELLLHGMLPVPQEDIVDLERAVWECLAASRRIEYGRPWEEQGLEDLDISWAEFVRGLKLSPSVEGYLLTWTSASDPDRTSALYVLVLFTTFGNSAWATFTSSMSHKLAMGTSALVDAITSEVRADIHLETVVSRVEQTDDAVVITTTDGRTFTATNAVLATPINTWADLSFTPPLSPKKQETIAEKHVGTGQKVWMQLTGVPDGGVSGCGIGKGVNWLTRDRRLSVGGDLYVAFTGGAHLDLDDPDAVRDAVRVYAPDAEVTRAAAHDWNEDPYAKGVWAVYPPGHFTRRHSDLSRPEGRLQFAGSDVSFGQQLWIEGAFETAFQVVDRVLAR